MTSSQTLIKDGWFTEANVMWPGQQFSLEVDEVLHESHSEFQHVLLFQNKTYGRVLVLDGVIQVTERDECSYQECIVNLPMFSHPNPKKVLIVGAGDGGVAREVARHPGVEKIVMVEIDKVVCDVSKQFLDKSTATGFADPRLQLLHQDGAKFLTTTKERFDVMIVDSGDPVGPNETLYQEEFYRNARNVLNPGGVLCYQGECQWLDMDFISTLYQRCRKIFPSVAYGYSSIPTYPCGQIGYMVCSLDANARLGEPVRPISDAHQAQLKYYTPAVHRAAFLLPAFAARRLGGKTQVAKSGLSPSLGLGAVAAAALTGGVLLGLALGGRSARD